MPTVRSVAVRLRGEVPTLCWGLVAILFLAEYAWWHSQTRLWDGDALDYVAMALRYAGYSTDDALRMTGAFFHRETTVEAIRGTLTGRPGLPGAGAYDLETPRMMLPLLAVPFIWLFGVKGVWLLTALCAAVFLWLLLRLLTRLFGLAPALPAVVLYLLAFPLWLFQTGIYTESVAMVLIVLILGRLPLERDCTRGDLVWLAVLVVLLTFTRQTTLVPMGAVTAAWLWRTVRTRSRHNEWARPAAVVVGTGIAAMAGSAVLFPWNELRHFSEVNHLGDLAYAEHHVGTILARMPGIVADMFAREFRNYLPGDHGLQVMWLLGAVATVLCFRTVYAALTIGAFFPCVLMTILDATGNTSLRYFLPMYPMLLMVVAALVRKVLEQAQALPEVTTTGSPAAEESSAAVSHASAASRP